MRLARGPEILVDPRWISSRSERTHRPPRAAGAGGFTSSVIPSTMP
ncbi:hypothetical protein [Amycolatopsis sulphurea]|nr:hypothetical protein [Amycolatopsis sulphurea]